MKNYQEGFCKLLGYNGFWFVRYELGIDNRYHKKEMCCSCMRDNCGSTCKILDEAVDVIPVEDEWRLKEES